jgi:hypothetical protein
MPENPTIRAPEMKRSNASQLVRFFNIAMEAMTHEYLFMIKTNTFNINLWFSIANRLTVNN